MHVRFIGDTRDAIGFSLAGVDSVDCHSRGELVDALEAARHDRDVAIVVLSPAAAALAEDVIEPMRNATDLPIALVLPDRRPEGAAA